MYTIPWTAAHASPAMRYPQMAPKHVLGTDGPFAEQVAQNHPHRGPIEQRDQSGEHYGQSGVEVCPRKVTPRGNRYGRGDDDGHGHALARTLEHNDQHRHTQHRAASVGQGSLGAMPGIEGLDREGDEQQRQQRGVFVPPPCARVQRSDPREITGCFATAKDSRECPRRCSSLTVLRASAVLFPMAVAPCPCAAAAPARPRRR